MSKQDFPAIASTVAEISFLYLTYGNIHYDEACSQFAHGAQCASLAQRQGHKDDIVIAAFLHDIGHLIAQHQQKSDMNQQGYIHHSQLGADFLKAHNFSHAVVRMVQYHVQAKRYLVSTSKCYRALLSTASRKTLQQQGNGLTKNQQQVFENQPDFEDLLTLRHLDDAGKDPDMVTSALSYWLQKIELHLKHVSAYAKNLTSKDKLTLN